MIVRLIKIPDEDWTAMGIDPDHPADDDEQRQVEKLKSYLGRPALVTKTHDGSTDTWGIGETTTDPRFDLKFADGFRWSAFLDEIEPIDSKDNRP